MNKKPILPYVLGIAGLVPFVGTSIGMMWASQACGVTDLSDDVLGRPLFYAIALFGYGAVILSFLGGTRWGAELARNPDNPDHVTLILSMLPPLLAWAAFLSHSMYRIDISMILLAAGLAAQAVWDAAAIQNKQLPKWYFGLRVLLTVVAVICLAYGAYASQPIGILMC